MIIHWRKCCDIEVVGKTHHLFYGPNKKAVAYPPLLNIPGQPDFSVLFISALATAFTHTTGTATGITTLQVN